MAKSLQTIEIFLQQGEVYFGDRNTRIRTLLGSCVAITMWHPQLLVGGMCHFMLPSRHMTGPKLHCRIRSIPISFPSRRACDPSALDGKYGDEALELMFSEIQRNGTRASEYQIKMFGGGNMFPAALQKRDRHVGLKNIEAVSHLLARHGLSVSAEHLGGFGHRNLIFDIATGHVWMRHQIPTHAPCIPGEGGENCLPA